jgi:hypothetical protein
MGSTSPRTAALAAAALAGAACGKQTFLAAAMLQTPAVPNPVTPSAPIPPYVIVTSYLGTIDTSDPTRIDQSKVEPVKGAQASIAFHSAARNDDNDLPLGESASAPGSYTLDSLANPKLTAEAGQQYTLVLVGGEGNQAYGAKLLAPEKVEIKEFHPEQVKTFAAPPASFTVTRSDGPGKDGKLLPCFVIVARVDPQDPTAAPTETWSNVPKDGTALLKFALSDESYRVASVSIPTAQAFPGKGSYAVALLVVRYGLVSTNTFLGSTALVAAGDAGLLVVQ